ncbi:MAG: putative selenate reductase subunit YgfK [Ruthenibacterium sp.]
MSDRMTPIPFADLMEWILTEKRKHGTVFGMHKQYAATQKATLSLFGETMETPFGPAAGPHTQLAQNIIASYLGGSRFFELKTVQTLDGEDLPVAKPCILATDEGYNVEWSTELYVPQAFAEYAKAWFALKLLSKEFELGDANGFVFNMSVGYDLKGIKTEKIDTYIENMKNAANTAVWAQCNAWAMENLHQFSHVTAEDVKNISPRICNSITLSTLHGCPPDEIERIATYLLTEKHLNTFIKCNPTMLGYAYARKTLDALGYDYIVFDEHHFKEDLQFEDAVPMLQRLLKLAADKDLSFGVKLTNTFPVDIAESELPGNEMYMSGRSLFPLSLSLAAKLSKAFDGKLRMSYSGGADEYNICDLYEAGIWPVTLATTLLKPGGYQRLVQIAEKLAQSGAHEYHGIDQNRVEALLAKAKTDKHYKKPVKPLPNRKSDKQVPLLDCFAAPCRSGCPIEQDIPAYLQRVDAGNYEEALQIILERNPLPFMTGTICAHPCMSHCTRNFYEDSVNIRGAKLTAAQNAWKTVFPSLKPKASNGKKIAVVGGGPAGMAAAFFLAREGTQVDLFEKRDALGGIVKHVIPDFRISAEAIAKDASLLDAMGVKVHLNTTVEAEDELSGYNAVVLATGAWAHGVLHLDAGKPVNVLDFLADCKQKNFDLSIGTDVIVVGGGNTAMDAARAAKRVKGVKNVSIVYRRNKRYMPADEEELQLAIDDKVEFLELLSPISHQNGILVCEKMKLGEPDASGRRSPVGTGEKVEVKADTVIAAVGEKVETDLLKAFGASLDARGRAIVKEDLRLGKHNVYLIGDGNHGPATIVQAIADAAKVVKTLLATPFDKYTEFNISQNKQKVYDKKGILLTEDKEYTVGQKCLGCATICENCVDVCPNRANVSIEVAGAAMPQIIHMDGMCNECGNCAAFCPYESAPYRDKFTLFWTEKDFENSENQGFVRLNAAKNQYRVRLAGAVRDYDFTNGDDGLFHGLYELICAVAQNYAYLFSKTE